MSFPYIKQIHVNDCYTYQNFDVPANMLTEFKHIILTGKNGTGKTTILNAIGFQIGALQNAPSGLHKQHHLNSMLKQQGRYVVVENKPEDKVINPYNVLNLLFLQENNTHALLNIDEYIFSHFRAHRKVSLDIVNTVLQEEEFVKSLKTQNDPEKFISKFKQYLVNKKVYEAFDLMKNNKTRLDQNQLFFNNLRDILQRIFEDAKLELEFIQESFEFELVLGDGRHITFNQLSEGFSAFISILMDLLMRVDLIRKEKGDYSFDPPGIALIDEPETHFHIGMQYEILPILTELFPKIQFIVATHSPAVISSIKNAVVYDLTSKTEVAGWQAGSSYSELMIKHFGLENEFSPVADAIIQEVNNAVNERNPEKLREIIMANEKYMTPSLKFEIENQIIAIESKQGLI
ncbi:AAA family ATPase [Chitinophaga sp. CF418]|uniref:AAA family ATPase n=1 Tax=Chitinophaga sp. CF418 TaxID=1855287 RepID=UPI0009128E54|nr:AAA family ATPase [Chitinophaga sp. CF418]SHN40454.1 Predicted ATP-binding protein involved in virulence [Chitinophaga sp. CF418]